MARPCEGSRASQFPAGNLTGPRDATAPTVIRRLATRGRSPRRLVAVAGLPTRRIGRACRFVQDHRRLGAKTVLATPLTLRRRRPPPAPGLNFGAQADRIRLTKFTGCDLASIEFGPFIGHQAGWRSVLDISASPDCSPRGTPCRMRRNGPNPMPGRMPVATSECGAISRATERVTGLETASSTIHLWIERRVRRMEFA